MQSEWIERTMGKMKIMTVLFTVAGAVLAVYFSLRVFGALSQGYSWNEMDWNQDGLTSIGEFFAASDIGKREITENGKKFIEYFSYKDGLPIKIVLLPSPTAPPANSPARAAPWAAAPS